MLNFEDAAKGLSVSPEDSQADKSNEEMIDAGEEQVKQVVVEHMPTKEEYDEGLRLGAAGNGDGAARTRIEVPDDVLKQVVCGCAGSRKARRQGARWWATRSSRISTTTATRGHSRR